MSNYAGYFRITLFALLCLRVTSWAGSEADHGKLDVLVLDPLAEVSSTTCLHAPIDKHEALWRTDSELRPIWDKLLLAERKGLSPSVFSWLRWIALGGGQDGSGIKPFITAGDPKYAEDFPSCILFTGGGRVWATVSLALENDDFPADSPGNHRRKTIQFRSQILGNKDFGEVPIQLNGHLEAPEGMGDAVAYILGNLFGLRGIRVQMDFDAPLLTQTGGFESSDAGRRVLGDLARQMTKLIDPVMNTTEMLAALRYCAPHVLKDYSAGGQGLYAAQGAMSRCYFVGGLAKPDQGYYSDGTTFLFPYSEDQRALMASFLELHSAVANPGARFFEGTREGPRYGEYTSGMMMDLARLGHGESLQKIHRLRQLVQDMEHALLEGNIEDLAMSTKEYTDIRTGFQLAWLSLAVEASANDGHPYRELYTKGS